jgi:hypothetical protein
MQHLKRSGTNVELAQKCLGLIRDIAERGASSWDSDDVGYALQELSQVLLERTGTDDREFEPVPADEIEDLAKLYAELVFVDGCNQDLYARHGCN